MGHFFENNWCLLDEPSREILLRIANEWTTIVVIPIFHQPGVFQYLVNLPGDLSIHLSVNENGDWIEIDKGNTHLSSAIGNAIDQFFL